MITDKVKTSAFKVRVRFGKPQITKTDKGGTRAAQASAHATQGTGRYVKDLYPKDFLKPWDQEVTKVRGTLDKWFAPYDDTGWRLGTGPQAFKFQAEWSRINETLRKIRQDLVTEFNNIVLRQRNMLGTMFNPEDYPSSDVFESRFRWSMELEPVPVFTDPVFKQLSSEIVGNTQRLVESRIKDAQMDGYRRLLASVSHLADVAADEAKVKNSKTSTLTNVQELVDILPSLNFLKDPLLDECIRQVATAVKDLQPRALKEDEKVCKDVAQSMRDAVANIETAIEMF